ncbi:MAG: hypothetical protein WAQ98_22215 [Blastocatellia bacterium]
MKTQTLRLEIFAGHGMCAVSGFVDFDFDKGEVVNTKLPYGIHEEIAQAWLTYDLATAQKICDEAEVEYYTSGCPFHASVSEFFI